MGGQYKHHFSYSINVSVQRPSADNTATLRVQYSTPQSSKGHWIGVFFFPVCFFFLPFFPFAPLFPFSDDWPCLFYFILFMDWSFLIYGLVPVSLVYR